MQTHLTIMDTGNHSNPNVPSGTTFEVSDFFEFSKWIEEETAFSLVSEGYNRQIPMMSRPDKVVIDSGEIGTESSNFRNERGITRDGREKSEIREKVAFKTKSDIEILDDGFKWRKYGKKMVKNSPNPRNYYRCSVEGCSVKKRVERDNDDPHYVVTTYEGIHNHQGPHR